MVNEETLRTINTLADKAQTGLNPKAVQAIITLLENGTSPEKLATVIVQVQRQAKESAP